MAAISAHGLRAEIDMLVEGRFSAPVTSCYINVDGRERSRSADYIAAFQALHHDARGQADAVQRSSVDRDLATIGEWLARYSRRNVRGLAFFVAAHLRFISIVELPVPVHDQIVVAAHPHVLQLQAIASRIARTGIAVIDDARLRLFVHEFGVLSEGPTHERVIVTHHDRQHGWNVAGSNTATRRSSSKVMAAGSHVERSALEQAHRHITDCAAVVERFVDTEHLPGLLLAGTLTERRQLEHALRERYQQLILGDLSVNTTATTAAIRLAAQPILETVAERVQDTAVAEIRTAVDEGNAICGLEPVLSAVSQGRARFMVLTESSRTATGSVCTSCGALSGPSARCQLCGAVTQAVGDVLEAAVERALVNGVQVCVLDERHPLTEFSGIAVTARFAPAAA